MMDEPKPDCACWHCKLMEKRCLKNYQCPPLVRSIEIDGILKRWEELIRATTDDEGYPEQIIEVNSARFLAWLKSQGEMITEERAISTYILGEQLANLISKASKTW